MWIHLNLIVIGLFTILVPSAMYGNLSPIIMSTFLFFAGMYLTTLYFILLYYKETRDRAISEVDKLKAELAIITEEKQILEKDLEGKLKRGLR